LFVSIDVILLTAGLGWNAAVPLKIGTGKYQTAERRRVDQLERVIVLAEPDDPN